MAGSAAIAGTIWLFQGTKPLPPLPQSKWPECASSLNYPPRIAATKGADGLWYARLTVKPPNAPCWMSYRAKATDTKGNSTISAPIKFYVTE